MGNMFAQKTKENNEKRPLSSVTALGFSALRKIFFMEVEKAGGQSAWARAHGLHRSNVNEMLSGKRDLSEAVINALGFVVKPLYIPVTEPAKSLCAQLDMQKISHTHMLSKNDTAPEMKNATPTSKE